MPADHPNVVAATVCSLSYSAGDALGSSYKLAGGSCDNKNTGEFINADGSSWGQVADAVAVYVGACKSFGAQ